jgi:hypothetical protein
MASASTPAPLLPVTNPVADGASAPTLGSVLSDASLATPASRLFVSRLTETARCSLADRKLWTELLDRSAFSRPDSLSDTTGRLQRNLGYFRRGRLLPRRLAPGPPLLSPRPPHHPQRLVLPLRLPRLGPARRALRTHLHRPRDAAPCSPSSSHLWPRSSSLACSSGAPSLQRTAHSVCQRTSSSMIRVLRPPMATPPTSCSPSSRRLDLGFDDGW